MELIRNKRPRPMERSEADHDRHQGCRDAGCEAAATDHERLGRRFGGTHDLRFYGRALLGVSA